MVELKNMGDMPESFLKEEVRNGWTVTSGLKEIWAVELDLYREFERVCDKLGLDFTVMSGTMLGAVRHKGFIPWDDDFDVIMKRKDYDVLMAHADEFRAPYFLQNPYTDKEFFKTVVTLRNSETTSIIHYDRYRPFNQGIYIDIFVVDSVPDNSLLRGLKLIGKNFFGGLMYGFFYLNQAVEVALRRRIRYLLPTKFMYRVFDRICAAGSGKKSKSLRFYTFFVEQCDFPGDFLDKTEKVPFEWMNVRMSADPKCVDLVMKACYGDDYMTPKNAPPSHGTTFFDTGKPYGEYVGKISKEYIFKYGNRH